MFLTYVNSFNALNFLTLVPWSHQNRPRPTIETCAKCVGRLTECFLTIEKRSMLGVCDSWVRGHALSLSSRKKWRTSEKHKAVLTPGICRADSRTHITQKPICPSMGGWQAFQGSWLPHKCNVPVCLPITAFAEHLLYARPCPGESGRVRHCPAGGALPHAWRTQHSKKLQDSMSESATC